MVYFRCMKKSIHTALIVGLLISVGLVFFNTFYQEPTVWHIVNVFYILIPLMFTCTLMQSARNGYFIALLLWIPALVVIYMGLQNMLTIDHSIWQITNMYILIVYSYLIGSYLCGTSVFGDREG